MDAFEEVWEDLPRKLELHTLQRRIREWRGLEGPAKELMFVQVHRPGRLRQSDFTYMNRLGVMLAGERFDHLLYHFVLTWSDWEAATICFSKSLENLSVGLQNALWDHGAVSKTHQTDRISTAVQRTDHPQEFTPRYQALLRHYGLQPQTIQTGGPNENDDVE